MATVLLRRIGRLVPALALALFIPLFLSVSEAIADQLHFNDGRVWNGTILQEKEELIQFRMEVGGIVQVHWVAKSDLRRIIREDKAETESAATTQEARPRSRRIADLDPDVPTLVFIPMEDMVGTYMNSKPLREALEQTAELGRNAIAVLVFDSGGGMLLEIQAMSDIIEEYKRKIRVVAWIKSAISAAAMTAHTIPEIYFMPEGNYGGCTGFYGTGSGYQEVSGELLEYVLLMMERISERGGYHPLIMRKMQVDWFTLSADIDVDGVVTFYPDDRGQYMVNPKGEVLTFNSQQAVKFGFARGIAGTEQELATLLQLNEWQRADFGERIMSDWHTNIRTAESTVPRLRVQLGRAMGEAGGGNEATRRRALGQARGYLNQLRHWHSRAEIICRMQGIDENWLRDMDRQIRELARRR